MIEAVGQRAAEFQTKARLARLPVPPLLPTLADDRSLYSLVGSSPEDLAVLLGSNATRSRCTHLAAYLNLMLLSLNDRHLRSIRLGRLRDFQVTVGQDLAGPVPRESS